MALNGGAAAEMANVRYEFGGEVVEVTSGMSVSEVNDALSDSNQIVLIRGGTYTGDIDFSGSNNRLRGVRVTGALVVPGSDAGISFSSVQDSLRVDGSNAVMINNSFCGSITVEGSGAVGLGNAGMAPLPAPSGGC